MLSHNPSFITFARSRAEQNTANVTLKFAKTEHMYPPHPRGKKATGSEPIRTSRFARTPTLRQERQHLPQRSPGGRLVVTDSTASTGVPAGGVVALSVKAAWDGGLRPRTSGANGRDSNDSSRLNRRVPPPTGRRGASNTASPSPARGVWDTGNAAQTARGGAGPRRREGARGADQSRDTRGASRT